MKKTSARRFQRTLNTVLIFVVVGLAAFVSTRYKVELDWTYGNRNTLTAGSQAQLAQMPEEIKFLIFDYPGTEGRTEIAAMIARYQRFKKNVVLEYVDPGAEPVRAREYNVTQPGQAVVEYKGRHESLVQMSETVISNVLQRLADSTERYVLFVRGHGERSTDVAVGKTQFDISQLGEALTQKGLKVLPLDLLNTPRIPENAAALVLASPTQSLADGEVTLINDFVKNGGNLFWITDPDYPVAMGDLDKTLGIRWQEGTVIFANYAQLGSPSPAVFFTNSYPPNAVTQEFKSLTAFPLARSIEFDTQNVPKAEGWTYVPIVKTKDDAWLEKNKLEGEVKFNPEAGDLPGPLTIGLTMTRDIPPTEDQPKRVQRIALFGDGDFLSDLMLSRYGNKQLATTIVQWVSSRDAQINIDVPVAPDVSLFLPPWAYWLYGAGFTAIIPLLLLTFGVGRWLIRRRQ